MYGLAFLPLIVYAVLLFVQALYGLSGIAAFICELVVFILGLSPTYSFFFFLASLALQGSGYPVSGLLLWDK